MVETASPPPTSMTATRWTHPGGFTVDISRHRDLVTVTLSGELELATAPLLSGLLATTATGTAVHVTLDLSQLDFIDLAGLTTILHARRAVQSHLGDLTIQTPSPRVRRLLELTDQTGLTTTPHPSPTPDLGAPTPHPH